MKKYPVKVRLANESCETTIKIDQNSFKPEKEFTDEIFGWIGSSYVAMNREDWERVNEIWNNQKSWELIVLNETEEGVLVSSPNGDTQWLSTSEWQTYKNNKKENDRSN
jgi:hypothetical protein